MATGVDGDPTGRARRFGIGGPEPHAFIGHPIKLGRGSAAMLTATLPPELAPTDLVGQDVDDIGPLSELRPERGKLVVDGAETAGASA
jgi:hypothetical protein